MTTAIIGLGNIGSWLARNFVPGGERIILADRTLAKAQQLARELGGNAAAMPVADAIGESDVVVLAIHFDDIKPLIAAYGGALAGKIIVDPTNPIAPDGQGGFKRIIADDQSSGQIIAGLQPKGAQLVRPLALGVPSRWHRAPIVHRNVRYCFMRQIIHRLGKSSRTCGFSPVSVGGIDASSRIEVGGDLHEFGKLGKLVSVVEAESLI